MGVTMLQFQGEKHLKEWLLKHPKGKKVLNELFTAAEMQGHLLAVQHYDRIDLYGHGPYSVTEVPQIHTTNPKSEEIAEKILEESLSRLNRRIKWPSVANVSSPGLIASLSPRKLTLQEYEWWQAYTDSMETIDDAGKQLNGKIGKTA